MAAQKRPCHPSAFTLLEMIVVVALVIVILGLLLPAASTMWNERKRAEAENAVQGLFMTARARAMQADGVESGLFAFVDDTGAQHFAPIAEASPSVEELADLDSLERNKLRQAYAMVFKITADRDHVLPVPMRAAPRYAINDPQGVRDTWTVFSDAELANNYFDNPPEDMTQRHRNFFTLVFSTEGHLIDNRDVLILDPDKDKNGLGDRTGLTVGGPIDPPDPEHPPVTEYYPRDDGEPLPFGPDDADMGIPFLVMDEDEVAINFPSVRDVLVYDDVAFGELLTGEHRVFLLRKGQPLYISRWTGAVVRGSVEEEVRRGP